MKYIMGLDNGGTLIKCAIFDCNGNQIACSAKKVNLIIKKVGYTERDMDEVLQANKEVIKNCLINSKIDSNDIVGMGLCGHGKGLYIIDKQGNMLTNGIVSTDKRASYYELLWNENGTSEKVFEKTYQSILACQPVCLLKWFKDNELEIYKKIEWVLSAKDYLRYKLTGEIYAEITDLSGTNLLNLSTKNYDKELLKYFDLEDIFKKLPEIKKSTDICGHITKEIAKETGLKEGTVVAGGMFDIDACALGTGLINEDDICVIGGTWSINEYISRKPVLNKTISMNSLFCLDNYYLIEECSPTSAGNLEWFISFFMQKEIEYYGGINEKLYNNINKLVEETNINDDQIIFIPFLFGSNEDKPINSSIYNLTASTTKGEILRAIYEGIVFSHKTHIDKLLKNKKNPKTIKLAGGVSKSYVWSQMFADIIGIKVETIEDKEIGCLGAAIVGGVAGNLYNDIDEAIQKTVSKNNVYIPNLNNFQIYKEKFNNYKNYIKKTI